MSPFYWAVFTSFRVGATALVISSVSCYLAPKFAIINSFYRGVAQLVEHRSPKPGVAGSSPVSPARNFYEVYRYECRLF